MHSEITLIDRKADGLPLRGDFSGINNAIDLKMELKIPN